MLFILRLLVWLKLYSVFKLVYITADICIKAIEIIFILHEIYTLTLDLKINQFKLDMKDVNDLNINNYYFTEFRSWNYFNLNAINN